MTRPRLAVPARYAAWRARRRARRQIRQHLAWITRVYGPGR